MDTEPHIPEKKVDESWKESANKEKCSCNEGHGPAAGAPPEASFPLLLSGLMMEAAISLGEAEHPVSKKKETHLPHAQYVIDTLAMLQEKTKNNLSPDESQMLTALLYNLRMLYLAKSRQPGTATPP